MNPKESIGKARFVLSIAAPNASIEMVGGKGAALAKMAQGKFPVPTGFHITTTAYKKFIDTNKLQSLILSKARSANALDPKSLQNASEKIKDAITSAVMPEDIEESIISEYRKLPGSNPAVAVRSSATAEDLPEHSFAGLQETFLNIQGEVELIKAVKNCWASLWTARAIGYRAKNNIPHSDISISVFVQILVRADSSGILFTANPVNGNTNQVVINSSFGLGESIVGGTVTPDTVVIDKAKEKILEFSVSSKKSMTVVSGNGTKEVEIPEEMQSKASIDKAKAIELTRIGKRIEYFYGKPMDIEWMLSKGKIEIVQARPITTLKQKPDFPTEWRLPEGAYMAMRNNIVEMMADPLTPLFGTLGLASVNKSMHRILGRFFGRDDMMPKEIIIRVNNYAYYNGSIKPTTIIRVMLGAIGIMKRMFHGAEKRWFEEARPEYLALRDKYASRDTTKLSNHELLQSARELSEGAIIAYGNMVSGIIPFAWMSEGLFTFYYKIFIKRGSNPLPQVFLLDFDSIPIKAEKSLFSLAEWIGKSPALKNYVKVTDAKTLLQKKPEAISTAEWSELGKRWQQHLDLYGHAIYTLDFFNHVPSDDPTALLELLKMFVEKKGVNPYERQQAAVKKREQAIIDVDARLKKGLRLKYFHKTLDFAQRFAPLREDSLADLGLGYPVLRRNLKELGLRFKTAGAIEEVDDIFWLYEKEVEQIIKAFEKNAKIDGFAQSVAVHKKEWEFCKKIAPPKGIMWGLNKKIKVSANHKAGKLKGVAGSPGQITGKACIIHGPEDFNKMKNGYVLVAPMTTPAWTPLFARALAIVTDIGGPLSHGSIVAREYNIPAVLGTDNATKTIQDNETITVNGDTGEVFLENKE